MGKRKLLLAMEYKNGIIIATAILIFFTCYQQIATASQGVSFRDDLKRNIELQRPAVRIVSLSEAHTENIVAIRAVRQLVGVTFSADNQWVLKRIPRISRLPSVQQIAELKPDVVLLETEWAKKNSVLIKDLEKIGIKAVVLNRPRLASLGPYLDKLGNLTGRSREATQALVMLDKAMYKAAIRSGNNKNMKVFIIAGADFSTCAEDSWGAKLLAASGAKSILGEKGTKINGSPWYIFWGPQKLVAIGKNVDIIITLKNNKRGIPAVSRESILKDPRFKNIPAVKNSRVWEMDESDLMLPSLVRLDSTLVKCGQLFNYRSK